MTPRDDGTLEVIKGLKFDLTEVLDIWQRYQDKDVCVHFRFKTRGAISNENVQPIQVLKKEEGQEIWMMHNGTIKGMIKPNSRKSDSLHFVEDYLQPLLRTDPNLIDNRRFQDLLEKMVWPSRVLFMKGDGTVIYLNKNRGFLIGRSWLSNIYGMLPPTNKTFENPPTRDEIKEKKLEKRKKDRELLEKIETNTNSLSLKYDPEFDLYYRTDTKTGDPVYTLEVPTFIN